MAVWAFGPLALMTSAGIPSSPGDFPHFRFSIMCSTSCLRGGGSLSVTLIGCVVSFPALELKSFSPYSRHLLRISSGSVMVSPVALLMLSCFGWNSLLLTVLILLYSSWLLFCLSNSWISEHSFCSQVSLSSWVCFLFYLLVFCIQQCSFHLWLFFWRLPTQ